MDLAIVHVVALCALLLITSHYVTELGSPVPVTNEKNACLTTGIPGFCYSNRWWQWRLWQPEF